MLPWLVAAAAIIPLTVGFDEMLKSGIHDTHAARLQRRVEELSVSLGYAAEGDLAVSIPSPEGDDPALRSLAINIDETLVSLRMLVDRVRDGGDRFLRAPTSSRPPLSSQASASTQADRGGRRVQRDAQAAGRHGRGDRVLEL